MKQPSTKALNLILEYEVGGGKSYYDRYLSKPTWPGGASGFTLGIGIDCGYYTPDELSKMFEFLPEEQLNIVKNASGKTGQAGQQYTKKYKDSGISVSWEQALNLFDSVTWPKFARLTEKMFPGVEALKDDAYGALVSLVFNRGTSLSGSSRSEMRIIRDLVPVQDYRGIAEQIRNMKRLWEGTGLDGLIARREAEAKLVESCV